MPRVSMNGNKSTRIKLREDDDKRQTAAVGSHL